MEGHLRANIKFCGEKIPTYIIVHSANTSYHCSSSSETLCKPLPMLIDKQIGLPTYILGLVLRIESHMKLLHNLLSTIKVNNSTAHVT
jgi:hypothetical protein